MKYNTFRNILWVVGALAGAGVLVYSCGGSSAPAVSGYDKPKALANNGSVKSASTNAVAVQDIMQVFESSSGGKPKLKDAFPSSTTKVNLYDDKATGKWTRAKIDYDRDEKDDEKWERDSDTGQITREISANDDGVFGPKQTWTGSSFGFAGADTPAITNNAPVATPPANTNTAGMAGALAVQDIMKIFEASSGGQPKLKDAFSGSATKVNLYDDKATGKWNRAKIDYDRDEKDDEKWERDPATNQITRMISASDDGTYGPKQTWTGSSFVQ